MHWLRKFYGPTIFFAPETEEGVETPETEEDAEGEESEETEGEESEETEGEESEETEGEESEDDTGAASASRRESRNARQARENRELRERTARLEGELNALKKPDVDPAEARRTREEKLALMSPEERMAFEAKEETAQLRNEARTTQFLVLDMADKNSYDLLCTQDSVAAKHKAEVEKLLANMRKNNTNAPRETLLNYVIGKHARDTAKKPGMKKKIEQRKQEANTRVQQSKGKQMSARGDAGGSGKGEETATQMRERILAREARGDVN